MIKTAMQQILEPLGLKNVEELNNKLIKITFVSTLLKTEKIEIFHKVTNFMTFGNEKVLIPYIPCNRGEEMYVFLSPFCLEIYVSKKNEDTGSIASFTEMRGSKVKKKKENGMKNAKIEIVKE